MSVLPKVHCEQLSVSTNPFYLSGFEMHSMNCFVLYELQICVGSHTKVVFTDTYPEVGIGGDVQVIFPFGGW